MWKLKEIIGSESVFRTRVPAVRLNSWQQHLNCPQQGFQNPLGQRQEHCPPIACTLALSYISSLTKEEEQRRKLWITPLAQLLGGLEKLPSIPAALPPLQQARWWNSEGQPGQSWWEWLGNSINSHFIVSSCSWQTIPPLHYSLKTSPSGHSVSALSTNTLMSKMLISISTVIQ